MIRSLRLALLLLTLALAVLELWRRRKRDWREPHFVVYHDYPRGRTG